MLKKLFTLLTIAALFVCSCAKLGDLNNLKGELGRIEKRVTDLESRCTQLNNDVTSLKAIVDALNKSNYVTKVEEIKEGDVVTGYKLSFKTGDPIVINLSNSEDEGIDLGVKEVDGVLYWTLNDEFLLDDAGNKLPVGGESEKPQFEIKDGKLSISFDGGETWEEIGKISSESDFSFKTVTPGDGFITIELVNGYKIALPLYVPVTLTLDQEEILAYAGDEVAVNYTINSQVNIPLYITVSTDGYYKAKVAATDSSTGKITITCPDPITPGIINVNVFDGKSYVATKLISVKENPIPVTIEGTYSLKEFGVFSFGPMLRADGSIGANIFPFKDKSWTFTSSLNKENDNKLILTSTGQTPEGYDKGTANYTPGADGAYWDYTLLAGKTRHTTDACDASAFYGFLPHGESEYVYNRRECKVTFTQGEKVVTVNYFPEGTHSYTATVTQGETTKTKNVDLTVPSMAFDFTLPQVYRDQFNLLIQTEGTLLWKDADWFLYYAQSCYMTFSKD